jgi:hypothetical protein
MVARRLEIAYQRFNGTDWDIYTMHADGTEQSALVSSAGDQQRPNWSPNGLKLVFDSGTPADLHAINADGTGDVNLTNSPAPEREAAWSPDGAKIAFTGFADYIYTMNADGSSQQQVTNNPIRYDYEPDWQPLPAASYPHPESASPVSVSLVALFRQCGTSRTPVNGGHAPPLGVAACNPPSPNSLVARVGASSQGSAQLAVVPGDSDPTNGDQADVAITVHLTDVQTTAGGDYDPNPSGADLTEVTRLRLTDRADNFGGAAGTAADLDYPVPVDCATTTGSEGAACDASTSADALTPGAIRESMQTVAQVFRVRLYDSGTNGVRENGTGDDRILAHQGIYIP